MEIHLMQHGACLSREIDPEQPLSPVGRDQVRLSALAMKRLGVRLDLVVSSPKKRAVQTAEIVAETLGLHAGAVVQSEAFKAMAPPKAGADFLLSKGADSGIFVAGHLPNLAELASRLLCGTGRVNIAIENGALLRLDTNTPPKGETLLRHYLTATHLAMLGRD